MIAPALSAFCILSKLTGICVRFFAEGGGGCAFYYKTMGRKGPLEEKYELVAHKRSRYDELLTSRLHCELRPADCPCPLHAAGSMKCRFWHQKCVI